MLNDELHVVHARAAGLDVHKMEITATVRLCVNAGEPVCETRRFDALAGGLAALSAWLCAHRVEAAAMEATGVYWETPWDALTEAGIEVQLLHAQQVKQLRGRKTDIEDSRWLARVCQFGLGTPRFVPARELRELRALSRYRRTLVGQRSRVRNRVGKVVDRSGARVGGVITDIFGVNGRRILDGLVQRLDRQTILDSLSGHVRRKLDRLGDALTMSLRDADRIILEDLLVEHDDLDRRLAVLDRRLHEGMADHADRRRLLETIPGIDRVSATAILVEASPDPAAVFGSAKHLAAWAGVCPANHESAGERQGARTRPGAKHLRTVPRAPETASSTPTTRHSSFAGATNAPSSPPPTSWREPSSRCCATLSPTVTPRSTTRRSWSNATPRAGSPSSPSSASWSRATTAP